MQRKLGKLLEFSKFSKCGESVFLSPIPINVTKTIIKIKKKMKDSSQTKQKRIYLSGPISGYDIEERRQTFGNLQKRLESKGWDVANPMANGLPLDAGTHAHMKRDFEMLLGCDAALFMDRWLHSAGCKVEFDVATAIGLEIFFEECFDIDKYTKFK